MVVGYLLFVFCYLLWGHNYQQLICSLLLVICLVTNNQQLTTNNQQLTTNQDCSLRLTGLGRGSERLGGVTAGVADRSPFPTGRWVPPFLGNFEGFPL